MYSPLQFVAAKVDGKPTAVGPNKERGRNVYSLIQSIPSNAQNTTEARLAGAVKLHDGWYTVEVRAQPTLNPDRLNVSVDVPQGWKIDQAPGMEKVFARRATASLDQDRTMTFRVHVTPDGGAQNLWDRLVSGG
jgi:hypothetical protein